MSDVATLQNNQSDILALMANQKERELEQRAQEIALRQAELEQRERLAESNLLRAQADEKLVAQRAESNRIAEAQNKNLELLLNYLSERIIERRLLAVIESTNGMVQVSEKIILVLMGKIEADGLLEKVREHYINPSGFVVRSTA